MKQLCWRIYLVSFILCALDARGIADPMWLYAIAFVDQGDGLQLVKIDTTDGSVVAVGDTGYQRLNSLTADSRGYLYSVGAVSLENSQDNLLLRIDPRTAEATPIADVQIGLQEPDVRGLSFGSDGNLYATINRLPRHLRDDYLWRIDPETGFGTLISTFDAELKGLEGLTTASNGVLYAGQQGLGLVTLDPDNGTFTDLYPDDSRLLSYSSLAFAPDGTLFAGNGAYYTIDLSDGQQTFIYDIGSERRGIAFLPGLPGDHDQDGFLTVADIELLTSAIIAGSSESRFDLNFDGIVDRTDRTRWVKEIRQTWIGDANLDGEFTSDDIIQVFKAGQYEDDVFMNSTWSTGDWNGDREFSTKDFVRAFVDGGYEQGPVVGADASFVIPEPSSPVILAAGLIVLLLRSRR